MVEECRVKVKFAGVLVTFAGSETIDVGVKCGSTLRDLLRQLASVNPRLKRRLIEDDGLWPGVYVAINDTDIRLLNGLDTRLNNGDVVLFLSYIHGG
ncbi:MoaD/ThiS family protein [Caldivirga maquilingensis]|uniref:ThiamineS protein n=1 Tax=Caldivirga maquilingensis (strain ATCC 700844 / DSM 13496 / JCM 10307 / IC-167) TaxID=397948 RepID=A8MDP2_CALMQ|nr:MoaD/ThiS family protein [Caldivirga maquilingensis]ABW01898.1 thiamineS protein [Caldivirga maquilingensis IC-167]